MRVVIVLPTDLATFKVGGMHTFVEGFIKFAPDDFELAHIGVTASGSESAVGRWARLEIHGRDLDFLPLMAVDDLNRRRRVPLALGFTLALARHRRRIGDGAVVQFHRPALSLPFLTSDAPKIQVIHLTSDQLLSRASESRWRRLGSALRWMERLTLPRMAGVAVVSEEGAQDYRQRFPRIAQRIMFVPNWVDDTIFRPAGGADTQAAHALLASEAGAGEADRLVLFVGRLEQQKDPLLALDAVAALARADVRLLLIGEGSLGLDIARHAGRLGIADRVRLLPSRSRTDLARALQGADVLLITSAHETGPTIAYEALACGLPVVSSAVGRVPSLVAGGGGVVAGDRRPAALADALGGLLAAPRDDLSGLAIAAAQPYRARNVLTPFYDLHRRLAERARERGG